MCSVLMGVRIMQWYTDYIDALEHGESYQSLYLARKTNSVSSDTGATAYCARWILVIFINRVLGPPGHTNTFRKIQIFVTKGTCMLFAKHIFIVLILS